MQFFKSKLQKDHRELLEIIEGYKTMMRSERSDKRQLERNLKSHLLRLSELETELGPRRYQLGFDSEAEIFHGDRLYST